MSLNVAQAVDLARQAILLMLVLGAPTLLVAMVVGLVLSLLQTVTQMQEQSLSIVPRMLATAVAVVVLLPWMTARLVAYTIELVEHIPYR